MAISQAMCTSFKVDLLSGAFATSDTFYIALYTSSATLSAATTAYTTSNEATGTGYTAGGTTITVTTSPTSTGTTAFLSFSNATWAGSTITARGALIYNASRSNKAIAVLDFGSDKSSTSGNFTVQMPTADATNAILRIA